MADFQIRFAGDSALLVQFEERIDPAINARAIGLASAVEAAEYPGVRDVVSTYRSVGIYFDPLITQVDDLLTILKRQAETSGSASDRMSALIEVPVCYGGEWGPDLGEVARFAGCSEEEVIRLHAAQLYRVYMLGFVAGFAYMGTVDQRIAAPRQAVPRPRVPAGSVGIAGAQTGIYPTETPGGWRLIGRTKLRPFDDARAEPCLFKPGDTVRFVPTEHLFIESSNHSGGPN